MNPRVTELVHHLHAGLQARKVYGEDHATWGACLRAACEAARAAGGDEGGVRLVAIGGRFFWKDESVDPDGAESVLAAALQRAGLSWVFVPGSIDEAQLGAFLRACDPAGDLAAASTSVQVGVTVSPSAASGGMEAADALLARCELGPVTDEFGAAWSVALQDPGAAARQLVSVIDRITAVVASARTAMLPLASLKSHDEYTYVHTVNVGIMSAALGEAVGLRADQVHDLMLGALLHDIGKQLVPPQVLNKGGKLDDAELAIMRRHPVDGARILMDAGDLPEMIPIIAYEHHMHLDGRGYPSVPKDWRPNLASQIVHVADVFDALRTNRPYRAALSVSEACNSMYRDADTSFDRSLLDTFFERVVVRSERDVASTAQQATAA